MSLIVANAIQPFALFDGDLGANGTGVGVANTAYLVGVTNWVQSTLTGIRVRFGAGGVGHYDVGIYSDVSGVPTTLLAHAAATATSLATATGPQTPALIGGNLVLPPARYWLALWIDNATDTINRVTGSTNMVVAQSGTNAGPLPAAASSLTSLGNGTLKPIIIGLITGGWS